MLIAFSLVSVPVLSFYVCSQVPIVLTTELVFCSCQPSVSLMVFKVCIQIMLLMLLPLANNGEMQWLLS